MKTLPPAQRLERTRRSFDNFVPPCCPHDGCPARSGSVPFRFHRKGFYVRACDGLRAPRFTCLTCRLSFSSQTFRVDYRLRKPGLLPVLLSLFVSKVTMRQAARLTGSKLDTVARHQRLLGGHCRRLQQSLLTRVVDAGKGPKATTIVFDELETFEEDRIEKPVTVPVVVDGPSLFVFESEVGALPPRRSKRRKRDRELEQAASNGASSNEAPSGRPRRSGSRLVVRAAVRRTARWLGPDCAVTAISDRKSTYPAALTRAFGPRLVQHRQVDSKAPRTERNPLFPVNHTLAMLRDGLSRLVRRSWAHSKKRQRLRLHLWIWIVWRNWLRPRTVGSSAVTPAMAGGFADQPLAVEKLLGWHGRFETLAGL